MQKITIQHLGPVQNLEIEIKDFNLLIGEQATGKSTVAKAVYFFRLIKTTLTDYLCQLYDTAAYNGNNVQEGFKKVLKSELKSVFISLFGYSWDLDERLYLKYEYTKDIWIDVKLNGTSKKYIDVRYSKNLTNEIYELEKEALTLWEQKKDTTKISLAYASKERLRNYGNFKNNINRIFNDYKETYYIPAGRSMITLLVNNRSMIENEHLDLITRQFMQIIDNIHGEFSDGIRNVHKRYPDGERKFDVDQITDLLISDLKGDYRYAPGRECMLIQDSESHTEKMLPINFASSGQQEVLWLLNQLYILMLKKEKAFVIIEEPEAHLYPNLQDKVIEFIAYFANINDSSVMVTTHSPYVLTSVNALYFAGKIIKKNPDLKKGVYKIIGNKREISPDRVSAFKINKDATVQTLIDEEFGEIRTEMIDEISDRVNEKYTELFYLVSEHENGKRSINE
ncbi:MAG: AAA family ATPase [Lachnospiraceae bacterium]